MTLKELRQKLASAKAAGKKALEEFNTLNAKTERTAEEETRLTALNADLDRLEAECADLDAKIETEERNSRRGALFNTTAGARVAAGAGARTVNEPGPDRGGFHTMAEFARSVRNAVVGGIVDPRLGALAGIEANAPSSYQQNQGSSGEGFMVPPEYSREVWEIAFNELDLLGMVGPEPTESNAVAKPKDETTPWGASGVQATWAAEAAQLNPSTLALGGELMTLHKLYAFVGATDEVLSDAPMLVDRITKKAGMAIGWKASDAVMWGTGAGQPTGFMNSPALVTQAKDNAQAAATVTMGNVSNMIAHLWRGVGKPFWLANQDVVPQLAQLLIGGTFPAYLPLSQPVANSPFDGQLYGHPVMFSEHAQTLGTAGDLTLVNPVGYYAATKRGGIDFASSMHLYFDQGITAFRWTFRLAGQPFLSKPIQPARGATTKSHFVALATRG